MSAEVLKINDQVQYQKDSIVSKALIAKKTGTVTLFAFDAGQALSEHTAPFDALVQLLEGEAEVSIDKKPFTVKAGELIILPAGVPHAVKAIQNFKMALVMIRS